MFDWIIEHARKKKLFLPDQPDEFLHINRLRQRIDDPALKAGFKKRFYLLLARSITWSNMPDRRFEEVRSRSENAFAAMVGEKSPKGKRSDDDWELLDTMFDLSDPDFPVESLNSPKFWIEMKPPKSLKIQPLARMALDCLPYIDREHSLESAERRLARKFKKLYPHLAARHVIGQVTEMEALSAVSAVAEALKPFGIELKTENITL
jgi:hypothetical protein